MSLQFDSELEQTLYEIVRVDMILNDQAVSAKLDNMKSRVMAQPDLALLIRQELKATYQAYVISANMNGGNFNTSFQDAVYPSAAAEQVTEQSLEQPNVELAEQVTSQDAPGVEESAVTQDTAKAEEPAPTQEAVKEESANTQSAHQPEGHHMGGGVFSSMTGSASGPVVQTVNNIPPRPIYKPADLNPNVTNQSFVKEEASEKPDKKKNISEFVIGSAVLSTIGIIFILTALALLLIQFFGGIAKALIIAAALVALLAFSELFIQKRVDKLAGVLSTLSVGGLFVLAVVNGISYGYYPWVVCAALVAGLGALLFFLYQKRGNVVYLLGGLLGVAISGFSFMSGDSAASQFTSLILSFVFMNISFVLRKERSYKITSYASLVMIIVYFGCFIDEIDTPTVFGANAVLLYLLVFATLWLYNSNLFASVKIFHNEPGRNFAISKWTNFSIVYCIGSAILFCCMFLSTAVSGFVTVSAYILIICLVVTIPSVCIYLMMVKKGYWEKCLPLMSMLVLVMGVGCAAHEPVVSALVCSIVLIVGVLLARFVFAEVPFFYFVNSALALISLFPVYGYREEPAVMIIFAVTFVILIAANYGYVVFGQIFYTTGLVCCGCYLIPASFHLSIVMGIFLLSMVLYDRIPWVRSENGFIFDLYALLVEVICALGVNASEYHGDFLTYICCIIFGLGVIFLGLNSYKPFTKVGKWMATAVFLTYMALVIRVDIPFATSVALMVIALVCVSSGFAVKTKSLRVYGLILSLFVCGKLLVFDLRGLDSFGRIVSCLIIGVVALLISGVYIVLDRKLNHIDDAAAE